MAHKKTPNDLLLQQLLALTESDDPQKFKDLALQLRKSRRGAPVLLTAEAVFAATETILEALPPQTRSSLQLDTLIEKVRHRIGPHKEGKRKGDLYSKAALRPYVRCYIYMCLDPRELSPHLFDGRQPGNVFPPSWHRQPSLMDELRHAVAMWLTRPRKPTQKDLKKIPHI